MNNFNKYRSLSILLLALCFISLELSSCGNTYFDKPLDSPDQPGNPVAGGSGGGEFDPNLKVLSDTDTECKYMKTKTETLNFRLQGIEGFDSKYVGSLAKVEVYFPLVSGNILDENIKYNIVLGLSLHKNPQQDDEDYRRRAAGVCGKTIVVGSHTYEPFKDKNWRFFTEAPICYETNNKFEILIKNYKSKDCTYEIIYNK